MNRLSPLSIPALFLLLLTALPGPSPGLFAASLRHVASSLELFYDRIAVAEPIFSCQNEGAVRLAVMADVHYLSADLVEEGPALESYEKATGRGVNDLHAVLDKVLADLLKENVDILLMPGDLTNHGERQSHLDITKKLQPLVESGIRVFVVPGNHDVNIPNARAYVGEAPAPVPSISAEEFAEIYAPFGYGDALSRDDASLSYLSSINDTTWLLAFDTNRYDEHTDRPITAGRIRPQTMEWALNILDKARKDNITVLGMMHHGLVEHMPYQSDLFSAYLMEEWERQADRLADAGLKVVFTGHFHSNDVSRRVSTAGNRIYDVETASLAQYPFAYRIMELKEGQLSIDSRFVTSIPSNPNLKAEYRERMKTIARRVARGRIEGMGLPMPEETLDALVDLIAGMSVMHARGDEKPDEEMREAIGLFAALLGGEADMDSFTFDFPPEDNRLIINLKKDKNE